MLTALNYNPMVPLTLTEALEQLEVERSFRASIHRLVAAILEGKTVADVAQMILEMVAEHLQVERVALFVRDCNGLLSAVALRSLSEEYAASISRLQRPHNFLAKAKELQQPVQAKNLQTDPQLSLVQRSIYTKENIESLLIAGLYHSDKVLGALVCYPDNTREFKPLELVIFQALADRAAISAAITHQIEQQREIATEEGRNLLAREIHDTVAQSLSAVVLKVDTALSLLVAGKLDSAQELLLSARQQTREALEETRRAIAGLPAPQTNSASLPETIEAETILLAEETDIEVKFILSGTERALNGEQKQTLFRITQEALTNVRKHAQAKRVRVGLQYQPDSVILRIEDDGVGFDSTQEVVADIQGGYGLFGMRERARTCGGETVIESSEGWGTRVRTTLPYAPARNGMATPMVQNVSKTTAPPIKVVVVDDHAIVRKGIQEAITTEGIIEVIGEADDGESGIRETLRLTPDVVLMDLQMPNVGGLEALRRILEARPQQPVVILTAAADEFAITDTLAAGAKGFLLKDTPPLEIIAAIQSVYRGETALSSRVAATLADVASGKAGQPQTVLQEREREVLELMAKGQRNKEIAATLFLSVSTVEKHIASLFQKLEVTNRAEAVRIGVVRGLLR